MRRSFLPRFVPLFLFFLAVVGTAATETYQLKLGFRQGEVRRYKVEESLTLKFQIPGQGPLEIKTVIKAVLRQEVLGVDPAGGAELACRMESWRRQNWANGEIVEAEDEEEKNLLGLRVRIKVSPQGETKLLEPTELPSTISLDNYAGYSFLPPGPVTVGEEWTKNLMQNVGNVRCPTTVRSRLEKVERIGTSRLAQIAQEITQEIPEFSLPLPDAAGQFIAAGTFFGAGRISFDLDRGYTKEEAHLFQGRLMAKLASGEAKMEIPMDMELMVIVNLLS
ncbi:MAG: hypothetical protein GX493_10150 [Firmicutes bacterium]|nr:hypothetical protein [Bacillota bacterium]